MAVHRDVVFVVANQRTVPERRTWGVAQDAAREFRRRKKRSDAPIQTRPFLDCLFSQVVRMASSITTTAWNYCQRVAHDSNKCHVHPVRRTSSWEGHLCLSGGDRGCVLRIQTHAMGTEVTDSQELSIPQSESWAG